MCVCARASVYAYCKTTNFRLPLLFSVCTQHSRTHCVCVFVGGGGGGGYPNLSSDSLTSNVTHMYLLFEARHGHPLTARRNRITCMWDIADRAATMWYMHGQTMRKLTLQMLT